MLNESNTKVNTHYHLRNNTMTDNEYVPCTNFGLRQHQEYPDHDFCYPCDMWDKRDPLNCQEKRTQKAYKCITKHTSYNLPSHVNEKKIFKFWSEWGECTVSNIQKDDSNSDIEKEK